jgi:adenylylsulfate kinase-like enzyme
MTTAVDEKQYSLIVNRKMEHVTPRISGHSLFTIHDSRMTIHGVSPAFAVWLTGLPASGKSTIVAALIPKLEGLGRPIEVLESDAVRRVLTPSPTYSPMERDLFYRALAFVGARLAAHGVTVVFDATANKRAYRDFARTLIPQFIEVAVGMSVGTLHAARLQGDLPSRPARRVINGSWSARALRSAASSGAHH